MKKQKEARTRTSERIICKKETRKKTESHLHNVHLALVDLRADHHLLRLPGLAFYQDNRLAGGSFSAQRTLRLDIFVRTTKHMS